MEELRKSGLEVAGLGEFYRMALASAGDANLQVRIAEEGRKTGKRGKDRSIDKCLTIRISVPSKVTLQLSREHKRKPYCACRADERSMMCLTRPRSSD